MLRATTACIFSTSQLPKVVRTWCALYILTWKCASRHSMHFFTISTSKSGPNLVYFVHFRCSIFKRAMLSHVPCILPPETTLQIESGRQRDPKESWREKTHRSFYTHRGFYTEKSLHKGPFYIQNVLHKEVFTLRSFCTQTSWSL